MIFTNRDDFSRLWFKFTPIKSLLVSETGLWLEPWRWLNNLRFQLTEGGLGRHGPLPCSPQEHTPLAHTHFSSLTCRYCAESPSAPTRICIYIHVSQTGTQSHTRSVTKLQPLHPQCLGSPRQSEEKTSEASVYRKTSQFGAFLSNLNKQEASRNTKKSQKKKKSAEIITAVDNNGDFVKCTI